MSITPAMRFQAATARHQPAGASERPTIGRVISSACRWGDEQELPRLAELIDLSWVRTLGGSTSASSHATFSVCPRSSYASRPA